MTSLHEKYLPEFHFNEVHEIPVAASPDNILVIVPDLDLRESRLIRFLFSLRGMTTGVTLREGLLQQRFIALETIPGREMMLGLIGQFWKANGNLVHCAPSDFISFNKPGFLKATWNFVLIPRDDGKTIVQTETRVLCLGKKARRLFSVYWFFIKPFSGLIRMEMLRLIRRKAESSVAQPQAS